MLAQLKLSQNKKLSGLRQQKENLLCSLEHIGMLAALLCCQNKKEGVIKIGIRRYKNNTNIHH
jgi:hypothetical protein